MNTMSPAVRTQTLNGSDAIDLMRGGAAWVDLWRVKTGRVPAPDLSRNFKARLGSHTEAFHLDWIMPALAEEGWHELANTRQLYRSRGEFDDDKDTVTLAFHADTVIEHGETQRKAVVEVKHSSGRRSFEEMVDFYMPQLQHQMWVSDLHLCRFSVIMGNEEPVGCWVGRSEDWLAVYLAACKDFWSWVKADVSPAKRDLPPPDEIVTPAVRDAIPVDGMRRLSMEGWNEAVALSGEYVELEPQAKRFEEAKKALKELMPADVRELYGPTLCLKRDKRGAIRITRT